MTISKSSLATRLLLGCLALGVGCKTPPPPPVQPPPSAPPAAEVRVDDIPADASPAIRAHLTKLREMRDLGQISNAEYQSRKAGLLGRR